MNKVKTIFVVFGTERLPFRFSIKSFVDFTKLTGKQIHELNDTMEAVKYFYCALRSGCNFENMKCRFDLDGWLDLLDDYPSNLGILTNYFAEFSKNNVAQARQANLNINLTQKQISNN